LKNTEDTYDHLLKTKQNKPCLTAVVNLYSFWFFSPYVTPVDE